LLIVWFILLFSLKESVLHRENYILVKRRTLGNKRSCEKEDRIWFPSAGTEE